MTIVLDGTTGITTPGEAISGNLSYTGTLTGGTGVVNLGSGQVYKDASGNVGIGTTTPKTRLNGKILSVNGEDSGVSYQAGIELLVNGASAGEIWANSTDFVIGSYSTQPLIFRTQNTERARIDSSGNLLVGTTSVLGTSAAGTTHIVGGANDGNQAPLCLRNPASTAGRYWKTGPTNNAGFIVYNDSNTGQYMTYGATAWSAGSDERLKTALVPFENAASKVSSLRAGTGRYLTDGETVSRSFLSAQSVLAVLPEAVDEQEDEMKTLGLRYTDVIPLLVAAIQEQQALIVSLQDTLTALNERLTALEAPIV